MLGDFLNAAKPLLSFDLGRKKIFCTVSCSRAVASILGLLAKTVVDAKQDVTAFVLHVVLAGIRVSSAVMSINNPLGDRGKGRWIR